jgi:hypothetical protein
MGKPKKTYNGTYGRLLAYAAHALAEGQNKLEPKELWREPKDQALAWKPCADQRSWKPSGLLLLLSMSLFLVLYRYSFSDFCVFFLCVEFRW